MKKYKFKVFDIDGCLRDSEEDYNLLYDSFEETEEEALKTIDRIEKSCKENFENSLITGYEIEEVKKK